MVRGIDTFKEFFKGFEDNYVIIGGTACEIHEDLYAQVPRATKDIDIILVVEALSAEFVAKFWEFVKKGNYEQRNKGVNENVEPKHEYFRFMKPANSAFPYQVELFSRSLGLMNFPEEARITPIPVDEDLSSLSAILMDEDYYRFTIEHSRYELPNTLKTDVSDFCDAIMHDLPNADFIKSAGLGNVTSLQIIEQLKESML